MIFENKVALVTGAGVRLGQQIAIHLSKLGMRVAVHYHRSLEGAQQTLSQLEGSPAQHRAFQADLCQVAQVQTLAQRVQQELGPVSVLINNAADFYPTPLFSVTEAQWDHLFELNLKAPFFLAQACGKQMQQAGGGKIINIVDVAANRPWPSFLPYCATKAGLISLTYGLARALAPLVHVNAIAPGTVLEPHSGTEIDQQASIAQSLLKRMGSAQDIVAAVDYLLHGDFLTGVVLPVDGGRLIS